MEQMFPDKTIETESFCKDFLTPIAKACHAQVGNFYLLLGQDGFKSWADTPTDVQNAWIAIVVALVRNPQASIEDLHNAWVQFKVDDGWTKGPKNSTAKTHPMLEPLAETPRPFQYRYKLCQDAFTALTTGWVSFNQTER